MSLRIAIVGCGKIADAHVEEIAKQRNARLVACCDVEELMAEQLAVRYSIPERFGDFDAMLRKATPDVVHIATPPQYHVSLAEEALNAGCHVFIEKPLALNYRDAAYVIDCAERAGRKLTVGWIYQFDPAALELQCMMREGVLGSPVHLDTYYGYDFSGPFGPAFLRDSSHWLHGLPGKLFHNTIDHLLNKLPQFMPDEPPQIIATAHPYQDLGVEGVYDELRVMIRCGRVTANAIFTGSVKPLAHRMTVYGTRNIVEVDHVARTAVALAAPTMPSAIGRLLPAFTQARRYWRAGVTNAKAFLRSDFHYFTGMNCLIARFYESILQDAPPPISHRDLRWVYSAIDEVFEQISAATERSAAACGR
jgi:predicted dehydrogenase